MKRIILVVTACCLIVISTAWAMSGDSTKTVSDTTCTVDMKLADSSAADQVIVYYLHGNRRCVTCKKLESFSEEAIRGGFGKQLQDSTVIWRVVNFQTEGNEHFVDDYHLFTQSLILSKVADGEEVGWRNLKDIWKLVGDKEAFTRYVNHEVRSFFNTEEPAVIDSVGE